jgi:uncharacterized protein YdeI (YjbR/CyaY-like superfamily)
MDDPIFFTTPSAFHHWLETHEHACEIWVGYMRKSTGRASLTWSASVDVALCFGWIDGIRKTVDAQRYMIRFTPRKTGSVWSAVNVKKAKTLIENGEMRPAGLHLFSNRSDAKGYSAQDRSLPLAPAFEAKLRANEPAWRFFSELAPSYRRDSIWWVMSAKKEETRANRLDTLLSSAEAGLKIPMLRKK